MNHATTPKLLAILLLAALCLLSTTTTAWAQDSAVMVPVQGLLTDGASEPLEGDVTITFRLYEDAMTQDASWEEEQTLNVESGLFTAYLGGAQALDGELFRDHAQLYLTMTIEGDSESDRLPLASAPYAAAAKHALDATTLQGKTPEELAPTLDASSTSYDDTQTQLGSENTQGAIAALVARLDALEQSNADLRQRVDALEAKDPDSRLTTLENGQADLTTRVNTSEMALVSLQSQVNTTSQTVSSFDNRIATVEMTQGTQGTRLSAAESAITSQGGSIDTLTARADSLDMSAASHETRLTVVEGVAADNATEVADVRMTHDIAITQLEDKTANMTAMGTDVFFTGVNLHVRNGTGSTAGASNGAGNLIVGYDEARSFDSDKTGSHNIIYGVQANYTSYGGLIGGSSNAITSPYSVIISGASGTASGTQSVIISGNGNSATDTTAVAIGGYNNEATGHRSVTVGGWANIAGGSYSSVLGGDGNEAAAGYSSIGGGNAQTNNSSTRFAAQGTISN